MPARRATPGTKQLNLEIDEKLFVELKSFVAGRKLTNRMVVEHALRRHFDNPPPPPITPPLPPITTHEEPAKPVVRLTPKKKGKK
jgi:hypothetical protein